MKPTVIRGDCFIEAPRIIPNESIDLIVTDPPYGKIVKKSWDDSWTLEKQKNLTNMILNHLVPGGTAYVWGGIGSYRNRIFFEWLAGVEYWFPDLQIWDVITWSKKRAYGVKDRYLFTREECAMLVKGTRPKTFHIPLLDEKRGYAGYNPEYPAKSEFKRRTNIWTDITELFSGKIHECEKPSKLAELMISTSSNPGDKIVDYFGGSGSTGVAAAKLGRDCMLFESSDCAMHV